MLFIIFVAFIVFYKFFRYFDKNTLDELLLDLCNFIFPYHNIQYFEKTMQQLSKILEEDFLH